MNEFNEDGFIIGTMTQSFSRLNSFYSGCRREWYEHYIKCAPSRPGFFGQYGGFNHEIIEKYAKGELSIFELSQYYEDHFSNFLRQDFQRSSRNESLNQKQNLES